MRKFKFVGTEKAALEYSTNPDFRPKVNKVYPENTEIDGRIVYHWATSSIPSIRKEWEEVFDFEEEKKEILQKANPNKALRYNEGKPQWSLVDFKSLEPFVRVLEFGALKYERENWKKEMELNKILDSAQRHLASMIDGEQIDQESGLEHAGHVICNMMFYIYHCNK
jgi:hypothetical protein